jgi:hypothetical protein
MRYFLYEEATGRICEERNYFPENLPEGINFLQTDIPIYSAENYYVSNGSFVEIPTKPNGASYFDCGTKQWVFDQAAQENIVAAKRSKLLYESDWTQIPNNPLTVEQQQAWASYRQELRDIPAQSGYPFNVIWPTLPA